MPRVVALGDADGFDRLSETIKESCLQAKLPLGAVAVLAPHTAQVDTLVRELNVRGIDAMHAKDAEAEFDHPAVKVLTLKSVKGLEFPIVVVTHVDDGVLPHEHRGVPDDERPTYELRDAREFFVACSRAMRDLIVTHREGHPSRFLESLDQRFWRDEP